MKEAHGRDDAKPNGLIAPSGRRGWLYGRRWGFSRSRTSRRLAVRTDVGKGNRIEIGHECG